MELDSKQKRQKALLEIRDLLIGAAFPLMLQLILSASVILFANINDEPEIAVIILVIGEAMLIAAYFIFGRQNGITAYRKKVVAQKKRELNTGEIRAYYGTGEYAVWKAILIGFLTVIPFMIFQLVQCLAPNKFCEFMLKYAFGWATFPFFLAGVKIQWLNFVWIVIPVGVHTLSYWLGGRREKKRQALLEQAQEIKDKKKK